MKILFLSLSDYDTVSAHGLYSDLLRCFIYHGHEVYMVSPVERKKGKKTYLIRESGCTILKLRIGNIQKTNKIEKGISLITVEPLFIRGIKKYFPNVKFDLLLYTTPPITFCRVVEYVKKRDRAKTYLLLKDIFPQNAVDIGMMSCSGIKGILYQYFRSQERNLYRISDYIGCMSEANVAYVLRHNPEVDAGKVHVCPNSCEVRDMSVAFNERKRIREKYGIPQDKRVFIYGGNLGKPQGIEFMLQCLHSQKKNKDVFFLIVGSGTEYGRIESYLEKHKPDNIKLMNQLPKEDYDKMVGSCDVGMIFLDHRFTIPNFPSRLLSYMQAKLPVLAVTDPNTDVGKVIVENGFGWWCESSNVDEFQKQIKFILTSDLKEMGEAGFEYFREYYDVEKTWEILSCKLKEL